MKKPIFFFYFFIHFYQQVVTNLWKGFIMRKFRTTGLLEQLNITEKIDTEKFKRPNCIFAERFLKYLNKPMIKKMELSDDRVLTWFVFDQDTSRLYWLRIINPAMNM